MAGGFRSLRDKSGKSEIRHPSRRVSAERKIFSGTVAAKQRQWAEETDRKQTGNACRPNRLSQDRTSAPDATRYWDGFPCRIVPQSCGNFQRFVTTVDETRLTHFRKTSCDLIDCDDFSRLQQNRGNRKAPGTPFMDESLDSLTVLRQIAVCHVMSLADTTSCWL
jgi:hypothetical protein